MVLLDSFFGLLLQSTAKIRAAWWQWWVFLCLCSSKPLSRLTWLWPWLLCRRHRDVLRKLGHQGDAVSIIFCLWIFPNIAFHYREITVVSLTSPTCPLSIASPCLFMYRRWYEGRSGNGSKSWFPITIISSLCTIFFSY